MRGEDHEGRQVVVLAAEAVGNPGTEARFARHLVAGHEERAGRVVVDGVGVDRLHHGDVVREAGRPRQQVADPQGALPVLGKFELRRRNREFGLATGHRGDALTLAHGIRQILAELRVQARLVVEGVELRRPAVHVQVNQPFGARRKVRESGQGRLDAPRRGGGVRPRREHLQAEPAQREARAAEELAARVW